MKASVHERLEEQRTAGPMRQRREVAAAMTLCKSHHTRTATPGRRCLPDVPIEHLPGRVCARALVAGLARATHPRSGRAGPCPTG